MGMSVLGIGAALDMFEDIKDAAEESHWRVGTNTEYAPAQEFGTTKMPAQPHLRPAVRMVMHDIDRYAAKAKDLPDLIRILALEIEKITKIRAPVDTGQLMNSYTAAKFKSFEAEAEQALAAAKRGAGR